MMEHDPSVSPLGSVSEDSIKGLPNTFDNASY